RLSHRPQADHPQACAGGRERGGSVIDSHGDRLRQSTGLDAVHSTESGVRSPRSHRRPSRPCEGASITTTPAQPAPADAARPRVVIGVDLPEELCARIEQAEPRAERVRDPAPSPPRRFPAAWDADPAPQRTEEQQRRFEEMVDSADVLFSLPDVDPSQFARTASANPRLRWVMTMAAGGGSQLRAAGLAPEQ